MASKPQPFKLPFDTGYVIGIDPGITGALALICLSNHRPARLLYVDDMPVTGDSIDILRLSSLLDVSPRPCIALIEKVHSMPRQAGAFSFGFYTGIVHGVLGALGIPFSTVPPATWKGALGLRRMEDEPNDHFKTRSRELASALYPDHADLFKRHRDDGRAEAALIATYGASCR